MKRFVLAALVLVTAAANFAAAGDGWNCGGLFGNVSAKCSKFGGHFAAHRGHRAGGLGANGGGYGGGGYGDAYGEGGYGMAPSPTVVYPYYTVRAPRDFLSPNPRGIGP